MKNLFTSCCILIIASIFHYAPDSHARITWSSPLRMDSEIGQYPILSYAPNGDLRVFYFNENTEKLVVRKRTAGDTTFAVEADVYDSARDIGIHYAGGDTIDLAVTTGQMVNVLQSVDNGENWEKKRSYAATNNNGSPCYLPSYFTEEDSVLRLIFGYICHNAVLGDKPQSYNATRISGSWKKQTLIGDGRLCGTLENDTNICAVTDRGIYFSTDDGANFIQMGNSNPIPEQLKASDMAVGINNRIYLLHNYSYGTGDNNKQLTFTYSDDNGATWSLPQTPVVSNSSRYFMFPLFAIDSSRMVAVWLDDQNSTDFGHKKILFTASVDGGQSWTSIDTIFSTSGTDIIPNTYSTPGIDIECSNGTATLVYSIKGDGEKHIYVTELKLNDVTENSKHINTYTGSKREWVRFYLSYSHALKNIQIENLLGEEISLSILNIKGQVIFKKRVGAEEKTVWVGHLPVSSGVYAVRVQSGRGVWVRRLLL